MATDCSNTFKKLKFPLHNIRWSWGAVNEDHHAVMFRFWSHQMVKIQTLNVETAQTLPNDTWCSLIYSHATHAETETLDFLGTAERRTQLELVRQGYKAFGICVRSKRGDTGGYLYEIESHISERIWVFGQLLEVTSSYPDNPDIYLAVSNVVKAKEFSSFLANS